MTDNEIIKALECCQTEYDRNCKECPYAQFKKAYITVATCSSRLRADLLDLINRQKADKENLEYILMGVMHSVDKWLEGDELKQDEVNRATTMREKTLQIVEQKQAEIERLNKEVAAFLNVLCITMDRLQMQ